jgi:hypothetical protein
MPSVDAPARPDVFTADDWDRLEGARARLGISLFSKRQRAIWGHEEAWGS